MTVTSRHHICTWPDCCAELRELRDEMDEVAIKYTHKMALDMECILAEYGGSWYNTAMQTLGEYRLAMNRIHEREAPTFMGEPALKGRT